jgi:hypothetical protein
MLTTYLVVIHRMWRNQEQFESKKDIQQDVGLGIGSDVPNIGKSYFATLYYGKDQVSET